MNERVRLDMVDVADEVASTDHVLLIVSPDTEDSAIMRANVTLVTAISGPTTPANSTVTSIPGKLFYDSSYLYVPIANNVIKRVALSSF